MKKLMSDAAGLARLDLPADAGIDITFVDDRRMGKINWEFLRHEGTTDVITFAYLEEELLPGEVALELIVCPEYAWREGTRRKRSSYPNEMVLYLVHGLLHAAGEDDLAPGVRTRMRRREREVMNELRQRFDFAAIFPAPDMDGEEEEARG